MNGLKQQSHHSVAAYHFFLMSAAELGSNKTCSAALMVANLSIKQPWHTKYCHLKFSFSDLSADNATHYMLTLTKIYAVKTKTAPEIITKYECLNYKFITLLQHGKITKVF